MSASDELVDRIVFRDLDILRFEASERQRVVRLLRSLNGDLVKLLQRIDPTEPSTRNGKEARIQRLQQEVRRLVTSGYADIDRSTQRELAELADVVAKDTAVTTNRAVGFQAFSSMSPRKAVDVAEKILVEGAPPRDWWNAQADGLRRVFINRVRDGVVTQEQDIGQIVRSIRGTQAARFGDGIRPMTERQAEILVRTSIQTTVNETRWATYQENAEVLSGTQASNPLDSRTSPVCQARAGMAWSMDGQPFEGSVGRFPGPPPWHWGCRTVLIPIFKTTGDLRRMRGGQGRFIRRQLERLSDEKRAALDGRPARGLTFDGWLKRRSEEMQREILGPTKFDLWQKGTISTRDLIDQSGRPLTVGQLRERFAE